MKSSSRAANVYTREDFQNAIRILVKRKEDFRKAVTHQVNLEGINGALEMLADPNSAAIKVIVHP